MNLLFAINGGYIPTFLNCMRSVLLHGGASHYEVFILHSDLTPADEERVRAALPEVGLHFVFVDPAMFDGFPESKRYPRQIYYRIAAPLLLPDTLERILYLDADTVIINPHDAVCRAVRRCVFHGLHAHAQAARKAQRRASGHGRGRALHQHRRAAV